MEKEGILPPKKLSSWNKIIKISMFLIILVAFSCVMIYLNQRHKFYTTTNECFRNNELRNKKLNIVEDKLLELCKYVINYGDIDYSESSFETLDELKFDKVNVPKKSLIESGDIINNNNCRCEYEYDFMSTNEKNNPFDINFHELQELHIATEENLIWNASDFRLSGYSLPQLNSMLEISYELEKIKSLTIYIDFDIIPIQSSNALSSINEIFELISRSDIASKKFSKKILYVRSTKYAIANPLAKMLEKMKYLTATNISLHANQINDTEIIGLGETLSNLTFLSAFHFEIHGPTNKVIETGLQSLYSSIQNMSSLIDLGLFLKNISINDKDVNILSKSLENKLNLTILSLEFSGNQNVISHIGLKKLIPTIGALKSIQALNLSFAYGKKGFNENDLLQFAKMFDDLINLVSTSLNISGGSNTFTEDGIKALLNSLAKLQFLRKMVLNIIGSQITPKMFEQFAILYSKNNNFTTYFNLANLKYKLTGNALNEIKLFLNNLKYTRTIEHFGLIISNTTKINETKFFLDELKQLTYTKVNFTLENCDILESLDYISYFDSSQFSRINTILTNLKYNFTYNAEEEFKSISRYITNGGRFDVLYLCFHLKNQNDFKILFEFLDPLKAAYKETYIHYIKQMTLYLSGSPDQLDSNGINKLGSVLSIFRTDGIIILDMMGHQFDGQKGFEAIRALDKKLLKKILLVNDFNYSNEKATNSDLNLIANILTNSTSLTSLTINCSGETSSSAISDTGMSSIKTILKNNRNLVSIALDFSNKIKIKNCEKLQQNETSNGDIISSGSNKITDVGLSEFLNGLVDASKIESVKIYLDNKYLCGEKQIEYYPWIKSKGGNSITDYSVTYFSSIAKQIDSLTEAELFASGPYNNITRKIENKANNAKKNEIQC